jgi:hypothetical protein
MKTVRSTILEMYKKAEDRVTKRLQKKGYLTYQEFDQCLQIEFNKLDKYYTKKLGVSPFSEEFSELVFDEYENRTMSKLDLQTLIPKRSEAELMEGGLIGLDKDALEKTYRRLKRRVQKE